MSDVSFNSRSITIDGQPTLLLTGSVHYPRSTPGMWPELMRRSVESGLNVIDTYVFWNLHEKTRGIYDFSDRLDLGRFCQCAQEYGLRIVLRIGPYICAETNYGGFPAWLREVPQIQMRTYNEPFMQEMERFVRLLCHVLEDQFAPKGGPIILAQLENEYGNIEKTYGEEGQQYLKWCADLGSSLNLGIPLVMCMGSAPGVIETINEGLPHKKIEDHFRNHPGQPAYCTELYPGWYNLWGGLQCKRPVENTAYAVARFIAAGGCGITYYMWHGGTNFGRESMYLQTTAYDFGCPLDEYGLHTTGSKHLGRLHHLLMNYSGLILNHERPKPQTLGEGICTYAYGEGESGVSFLCNDSEKAAVVQFQNRSWSMPAQSVRIFAGSRELMNTAVVDPADIVIRQNTVLEGAVVPTGFVLEPTPSEWPEDARCATLAETPVNQLDLTHDTTDYCWYSTVLHIPAESAGEGILTLTHTADVVHVFVDEELVGNTLSPLIEDRGRLDGDGYRQAFQLNLEQGSHDLSILCCSLGLIKGDWMLGFQNMSEECKGMWGSVLWNDNPLPGPWEMQPGLIGEMGQFMGNGEGLVDWDEILPADEPLAWYRFSFDHPGEVDGLAVDLSGMNKGIAYLNGKCIGRYWLAKAEGARGPWLQNWTDSASRGKPVQSIYHLPLDWLSDSNLLILFAEIGGDPDTVQLIEVKCA